MTDVNRLQLIVVLVVSWCVLTCFGLFLGRQWGHDESRGALDLCHSEHRDTQDTLDSVVRNWSDAYTSLRQHCIQCGCQLKGREP